jgi:ribosome-associated protein
MTAEAKKKIKTEELLTLIQDQIEDRKGEHLVILDLRGLSTVTDYFVIATGNSTPHLKAIAEQTEVNLRKLGHKTYRKAGDAQSEWFVLDYVHIVVHVMSAEMRETYDLESLWSDAPVLFKSEAPSFE